MEPLKERQSDHSILPSVSTTSHSEEEKQRQDKIRSTAMAAFTHTQKWEDAYRHIGWYGTVPNFQHIFREASANIILEGLALLNDKIERGESLEETFWALLDQLSRERRQLAQKNGSANMAHFGLQRDRDEEHDYSKTILNSTVPDYEVYNQKVLAFFKKYFMDMRQKGISRGEAKDTKSGILLKVSIIDPSTMESFEKKRAEFMETMMLKVLQGTPKTEIENALRKNRDVFLLNRLEDFNPEACFIYIKKTFRVHQPYSDFLIGEVNLVREGVSTILTTYILPLDMDNNPSDPLKDSCSILWHTDKQEVPELLKSIAKHWQAILSWDRKSEEDLYDAVCDFCFEFAHTMPNLRGDGAILEWFHAIAYGYLGFQVPVCKPEDRLILHFVSTPFKHLARKKYPNIFVIPPAQNPL